MRIAASFAVMTLFLVGRPAYADTFTILPNGNIEFNVTMSTRGVFTCLRGVPCSGSGTNSITIGSGTNTARLTYTGVNASFGVGNIAKQVSLGTVQTVLSDGFTFPRTGALGDRGVFRLALSVAHTSPTVSTRHRSLIFGPGGRPDAPLLQSSNGGNSFVFPTGPQPAGYHYTAIDYSMRPWPFTIRGNARTDITARVGATPEPSTLLLLGSGLAYGAYARRRKRAARSGQLQ